MLPRLVHVDEAIPELRKAIEIEPAFGAAHQALWGAWYLRKQWHAALSEARAFFSVRGQGSLIPLLSPPVTEHQYRQSMYNAARQLVEQSHSVYVRNLHVARLYAHAGERDDACAYLEKACSEKESPLVHLAVGWDWEAIHADARFQSLVKRIGFR